MFGLLAALATTSISYAEAPNPTSNKEYKQPVPAAPETSYFKDTELQLDMFGSYTDVRNFSYGRPGGGFHDGLGGGIAINYFTHRYFGVSISGNVFGGRQHGVWQPNIDGVLRYPFVIGGSVNLAPYIFGGGGGSFARIDVGSLDAGAGIEYRVTPHIGIFTEGRYTWTQGTKHEDNDQVRTGLRFVF